MRALPLILVATAAIGRADTGLESFEFIDDAGVPLDTTKIAAVREDTLVLREDFVTLLVYSRTSSGWTPQATIEAPAGLPGSFEPPEVASGIVAVPLWDDFVGPVLIYERSGTTWSQTAQLETSTTVFNAGRGFGFSMELSGDTIAIGAPFEWSQGTSATGSTYVFRRTSSGWIEEAALVSPGPETFQGNFGSSVALDGELLLIGAPRERLDSGNAYAYRRVADRWQFVERLAAPSAFTQHRFGSSVALSNDRALIGAPQFNTGLQQRPGFVCALEWDGSAWIEDVVLQPNSPNGRDLFGSSIALEGDTALIGGRASSNCITNSLYYVTWFFEHARGKWRQRRSYQNQVFSCLSPFSAAAVPHIDAEFAWPHFDWDDQTTPRERFRVSTSEFRTSCEARGSTLSLGCSICPCGNTPDSVTGGCLNEDDRSCFLEATGSPSITNDTLSLSISGATRNSVALLVAGSTQLPLPGSACPTGTGAPSTVFDGLRCLGGDTVRQGTRFTDENGRLFAPWGDPPVVSLIALGGFNAGETRHFQVIYRSDPDATCETGLNTSNVLSMTFKP